MKKSASISAVLLFLTILVGVLGSYSIIMALPLIGEEFQLNPVEQGAIVSVYFLGFAIFTIPGGIIADKRGSKQIIVISLVLWAILTALTGAVTGFAALLVVRFLLGFIDAPLMPAMLKAIAERTPANIRTTTLSIVSSAEPIGTGLAPFLVAPLIAILGWQEATFVTASIGLLLAPILWIFLPRPFVIEQPSSSVSKSKPIPFLSLIRNGHLWKLTSMLCGIQIVMVGCLTWVPTYLTTEKHLAITQSGLYASLPLLISMLGYLAGGWLFDRYFHQKFRTMVIPSLLFSTIFLTLMILSDNVNLFLLFESISLFFLSLTTQPILGLTMRIIPSAALGTASGILLTGGKLASIFTPIAMGAFIQAYSFQAGFSLLLVGAGIAFVSSFLIHLKRSEELD
ncbi:MFS transporter [Brevibacillus sp. HB1.4B]|uniref:MFS transporter n=1 Tax=unclassified Brevibacillus TaxID=2684853 RepID=UPI000382ACBC|nr:MULTISPECIES: MFS transporter [unclassified Brevibacillus]ATF13295.1 MFS transporter [Brevibacillus brevis X23]NRS15366.1 MFS transporter [Brevibacillus sp. HB1.4B]NTU29785.1 MFS transporter [Brevibacillus sp. HB1.1]